MKNVHTGRVSVKYCNLQHKQNRRVDFLLATLMKIARDKTFERLLKQEKGKNTHRVCKVNKRHKAAEQMQASQQHVSQVSENMESNLVAPG